MSDSKASGARSARVTALERRRALSHNGGASLPKSGALSGGPARRTKRGVLASSQTGPATQSRQVPADPQCEDRETATVVLISAAGALEPVERVDDSRESRECGCGDVGSSSSGVESVVARDAPGVNAAPVSGLSRGSTVKNSTRERRKALSSQGKSALQPSTGSAFGRSSAMPGSTSQAELSGRDAARAHRTVLCEQGRGDQAACRPSGRLRKRPEAPAKVGWGTTLSGTPVSGTQVERSIAVTGSESGSCRQITGTEYVGSEQYGLLCASTPDAAAAKVAFGRTARGQSITGTKVDRGETITGDEAGSCRAVTGTEYLSAEKFVSYCNVEPYQPPAKVKFATTEAGQRVGGPEVGGGAKVTGGEEGSSLRLTGSQYHGLERDDLLGRRTKGAPRKVTVMMTPKNQAVTGTESASGEQVTGADRGACAGVTGTELSSLAQYQACNRRPPIGPRKVEVVHTLQEQPVTGTSVERSVAVTGDEAGTCQQVTGTEYAGADQYAEFCGPIPGFIGSASAAGRGGGSNVTGTRLRLDGKVTGASRGESASLSGTPYDPRDDVAPAAGVQASDSLAPMAQAVAAVSGTEAADRNFSVTPPVRVLRNEMAQRVTGTGYGGASRLITGPVNLAIGLVSGTPEFRYRDEAGTAESGAVAASPASRTRFTGDGREQGFSITGSGWSRSETITGTEGVSARRNPTLRGERRDAPGANRIGRQERLEAPANRVTGSSASDPQGPAITYSGGSRG